MRATVQGIFDAVSFFIALLFRDPFQYFSWVVAVAFSVCFHEYAHAIMALKWGDDTAARTGHLSMNPMVQMGPSSLVMLLICGIAWGAVPVDPGRVRSRFGAAVIAFAGPGANLLLSLVFGALTVLAKVLVGAQVAQNYVAYFFAAACAANAVLFIFNMLPIPMLDGWPIFSFLFPGLRNVSLQAAQNLMWVFVLAVFMTPVGGWIWQGGAYLAAEIIHAWESFFLLFVR
jgi:Zn-dependent protease